jgi:hypothetical protein
VLRHKTQRRLLDLPAAQRVSEKTRLALDLHVCRTRLLVGVRISTPI